MSDDEQVRADLVRDGMVVFLREVVDGIECRGLHPQRLSVAYDPTRTPPVITVTLELDAPGLDLACTTGDNPAPVTIVPKSR